MLVYQQGMDFRVTVTRAGHISIECDPGTPPALVTHLREIAKKLSKAGVVAETERLSPEEQVAAIKRLVEVALVGGSS